MTKRRIAAAAVATFAATFAAVGCRVRPPTPTRPPISYASPSPPATLPSATATVVPTPTPTAIPTYDPRMPLPVAMTLDEARTEVLSWLDPDHAPRIVAADVVPGAALAAWLDGQRRVVYDQFESPYAYRWPGAIVPAALVRVLAESLPLEWPLLELPLGLHGTTIPAQVYGEGERARILALFDATTGARLAAVAIWSRPSDEQTAMALPTAGLTIAVTAVPPTATRIHTPPGPTSAPTPVPTPDGPIVDRDAVPPTLHAVLTAYPLLPGSTWSWDVTSWFGDVRWSRARMTETVLSAWQIDEQHVVVRSTVEVRRWLGAGRSEPDVRTQELWRRVGSDGVVAPHDRALLFGAHVEQAAALGLPLEALHHIEWVDWSLPYEVAANRTHVTTPAGRFEDCGAFEVVGGAGWGSVRAICPGVGYVESDLWAFGGAGSMRAVTRLVSYDVVLPR